MTFNLLRNSSDEIETLKKHFKTILSLCHIRNLKKYLDKIFCQNIVAPVQSTFKPQASMINFYKNGSYQQMSVGQKCPKFNKGDSHSEEKILVEIV